MNGTREAHRLSAGDFPAAGTPQEKLHFLLSYAILAPSSHNSQPWRFRLEDDTVALLADRSRSLPIVDPQDRELIISCGAALDHLQTALHRFGHAGAVQLFPDPANRDLLARIGVGDLHVPNAQDERLFQSLFARHTNRKPFHSQLLSPEILGQLDHFPLPAGIWLRKAMEGRERERLADLIAHADSDQVADCRFRRELASWIRPHSNAWPENEDGIPAVALGMPGLIAEAGPFLVRTFDTGALFAARDRQLAINSPLLIVLGTEEETPLAWLQTGQALSQLLLAMTAEGVVASFLNAPVEVAELRPRVAEILGRNGYPQLILRLGYSEPAEPTPRRSLHTVIESKEIM